MSSFYSYRYLCEDYAWVCWFLFHYKYRANHLKNHPILQTDAFSETPKKVTHTIIINSGVIFLENLVKSQQQCLFWLCFLIIIAPIFIYKNKSCNEVKPSCTCEISLVIWQCVGFIEEQFWFKISRF